MSFDSFLGPYVSVDYVEQERVDFCQDKGDCPDPQADTLAGYCQKCGIVLRGRIKIHRDNPDFFELLEEKERLTCLDTDKVDGDDPFIVIPNLRGPNGWFTYDVDAAVEIDADLIEQETTWFKVTFEKELTILRNTFGHVNVAVSWGMFRYWT